MLSRHMSKYAKYSFIVFLLLLAWNIKVFLSQEFLTNSTVVHSVSLLERVLLTCHGGAEIGATWKHADKPFNAMKVIVNRKLRESVLLSKNYSLFFKSLSLSDEGIYLCKHGGHILARHFLEVQEQSMICKYSVDLDVQQHTNCKAVHDERVTYKYPSAS